MQYNILVTGGTFDHFHQGHKAFLSGQLQASKKVLIGITSDAFIAAHKKEKLETYETRVAQVREFLQTQHAVERIEIQKIEDIYIPDAWKSYPIEAIAVTKDSMAGADGINAQRINEGLSPLPIYSIPYVLAEDGMRISSSRIRNGEINREGKLFFRSEWKTHTLVMAQELRETLAKPFGTLFSTIEEILQEDIHPRDLVSIGDVVTHDLQKHNVGQKISVVDLVVQRKQYYSDIAEHGFSSSISVLSVTNPSGCITPQLVQAVEASIAKEGKSIILVDGEEDLAVLPFVLLAPLHYHILYGQPHKGIVLISVSEEKKQMAKSIVDKFTILASN